MKHQVFISSSNFIAKYELHKNSINVYKSIGNINPRAFKKIEKENFVDEKYFLRRVEFKKKVWLQSHDFYFWLSKHFIDNHIARLFAIMDGDDSDRAVNVWNMFLYKTLFYRVEGSILSYYISPTFWKFWRYARWIFNHFHKIRGVSFKNRDIERLLS
jgi:hypothetical protein